MYTMYTNEARLARLLAILFVVALLGAMVAFGGCVAGDSPAAAQARAEQQLELEVLASLEADLEAARERRPAPGWTQQVRRRQVGYEEAELARQLLRRARELPTSDRAAHIEEEARGLLLAVTADLLAQARRERSLSSVERALDLVDFGGFEAHEVGVDPEELWEEVVEMARAEVKILRPRITTSADAVGLVAHLVSRWGFSHDDLGLTEAEVEALRLWPEPIPDLPPSKKPE